MRSCSAHNDVMQQGVWEAAEHRWWCTTTKSESVLTHSEKAQLSWYTQKYRCTKKGKKTKTKPKNTTMWHHWTKQLTTTHQNVHRKLERQKTLSDFYKTKYHLCISFLDLLSKRTKWDFDWQQMTCIWVEYAGMILYNFMQRWGTWVENRQLFLNGCLHWEVWPAWGGCPFSPSPCLRPQSPGLYLSG